MIFLINFHVVNILNITKLKLIVFYVLNLNLKEKINFKG